MLRKENGIFKSANHQLRAWCETQSSSITVSKGILIFCNWRLEIDSETNQISEKAYFTAPANFPVPGLRLWQGRLPTPRYRHLIGYAGQSWTSRVPWILWMFNFDSASPWKKVRASLTWKTFIGYLWWIPCQMILALLKICFHLISLSAFKQKRISIWPTWTSTIPVLEREILIIKLFIRSV